jgi:CRISPR-associated protein Cmr5
MPAVIVMNGLGQALAMQLAKAENNRQDPHYRLYHQVASWLSEHLDDLRGHPDQLLERLLEQNQQVYLRAQAESLAYLSWLKQFARAYLNETEGDND